MTREKNPVKGATKQKQKFIEAARKLGCVEDEKNFEETIKKIVPPKPKSN